ncbi:MAG: hypothetical protein E7379_01140 [Clostridiales bacterium]|nr:hypothetical protein [Clostridiales bacterium]
MKQIIVLLIVISSILLTGCNGNNIHSVISERTTDYYYGEMENVKVSLAVGQREEPYVLDGKHGAMVDFSLLAIDTGKSYSHATIDAMVSFGGSIMEVSLELNPLNMTYMADLGKILWSESVCVEVENQEVNLRKISDDFSIDYKKAVEIGESNTEIGDFKQNGRYSCEGYVKIVEGKSFGQTGFYWCVTILNESKRSNVLINTLDEKDIIKL